jgi:hypothetical protein
MDLKLWVGEGLDLLTLNQENNKGLEDNKRLFVGFEGLDSKNGKFSCRDLEQHGSIRMLSQ